MAHCVCVCVCVCKFFDKSSCSRQNAVEVKLEVPYSMYLYKAIVVSSICAGHVGQTSWQQWTIMHWCVWTLCGATCVSRMLRISLMQVIYILNLLLKTITNSWLGSQLCHWAWLRQGYWRYRNMIDWLIDILLVLTTNQARKPNFMANLPHGN